VPIEASLDGGIFLLVCSLAVQKYNFKWFTSVEEVTQNL
jgi:hypothetical protein